MLTSYFRRLSRLVPLICTLACLVSAAAAVSNGDGDADVYGVTKPAQVKLDPELKLEVRHYIAISNHAEELLGNLDLSRKSASFSKLTGAMVLQYAGHRTGNLSSDWEFSGEVFRVVNAEEFFAENRGKNGFCHSPVRWLTILDLSDEPPPAGPLIRVGMLTIGDWHNYEPTSLGACMAATFAPRAGSPGAR